MSHLGATRNPEFRDAAIAQLARFFRPLASTSRDVFVKDWNDDVATATQADRVPPAGHPTYSAIPSTARLIFAGSETSPVDGGFLEGALAAAEAAYACLGKHPD